MIICLSSVYCYQSCTTLYTTPLYANALTDCLPSFRLHVLFKHHVSPSSSDFEWIIILIIERLCDSFDGGGWRWRGGGGSLLTVSLKRGAYATGKEGAAVHQLEVSACRSGLGLTLRRACPCFSAEIQRDVKAPNPQAELVPVQILITTRLHGWTQRYCI